MLLFTINPIGMVILVNYIKSIPKELMRRQLWMGVVISNL
jgi:ABC-type glycerol-3-phosphate transport system permease component